MKAKQPSRASLPINRFSLARSVAHASATAKATPKQVAKPAKTATKPTTPPRAAIDLGAKFKAALARKSAQSNDIRKAAVVRFNF
jgi:hypothetical protein